MPERLCKSWKDRYGDGVSTLLPCLYIMQLVTPSRMLRVMIGMGHIYNIGEVSYPAQIEKWPVGYVRFCMFIPLGRLLDLLRLLSITARMMLAGTDCAWLLSWCTPWRFTTWKALSWMTPYKNQVSTYVSESQHYRLFFRSSIKQNIIQI